MAMAQYSSYAAHLIQRLKLIEQDMMRLLDLSTVLRRVDDPYSGVLIIAPDYYWGQPDDKQRMLQMKLKDSFSDWSEHFNLLFSNATESDLHQIEETQTFVNEWIEKGTVWSLSPNMEDNKRTFKSRIKVFFSLLQMLVDSAHQSVILIPDTNALIKTPDPVDYIKVAGQSDFQFVILPTILAELDHLKIAHRDATFRQKVESIITRIKGWRNQGSLLAGVTVNKTIKVRTIAGEPNFDKTLHWLRESNNDDRIIASVLEFQRSSPASTVIIVTGDINLQNKAEAANLPFSELP